MTLAFIRSGPDNSRALWHIRSPTSKTGSGVPCGRSVSGPTADSLEAVGATGRPLCERCDSRRDELIREAVFLLVALGVDMAVEANVVTTLGPADWYSMHGHDDTRHSHHRLNAGHGSHDGVALMTREEAEMTWNRSGGEESDV